MTPQNRIEQYLAAIKAAWTGETPLPEYPSEPAWRIESFLAAILSAVKGDSPVLSCPDPVWDIEAFGRAIYDALTGASPAWPCPVPANNTEMILYAIYKAVSDGGEEATPLPAWNIERWLLDVYEAAKEGGDTKATVAGVAPITLSDAISAAIISLKQYGLCTQAATPTPEAPVDIMCNNGKLVVENGQVVANGEDEMLYIKPGLDIELLPDAFEQGGINSSTGKNSSSEYRMRLTGYIDVEGDKAYVISSLWTDSAATYDIFLENVFFYDEANEYISNKGFGTGHPRGVRFITPANCAKVRFVFDRDGATIDISCFVSARFFKQKESVSPAGTNLFNRASGYFSSYLNSSGNKQAGEASQVSDFISVGENTVYRFSAISGQHNANNKANNKRVVFYNAGKTKIGDVIAEAVDNANTPYAITFTTPANAAYVRLSLNIADYDAMLKVGSEEIDYEPYVDTSWQTASVPMLLSVGDVKDEVELIGGHADRAVTVFRVSPDMDWTLATGTGYKLFYTTDTRGQLKNSVSCMSNIAPYGCTASNRASYQFGCYTGSTGNLYFQMIGEASISTVDDWKDFLSANAVYVVAAKATATTEQITAQNLVTNEGTNIVDSVANVSPVELEATYKKSRH